MDRLRTFYARSTTNTPECVSNALSYLIARYLINSQRKEYCGYNGVNEATTQLNRWELLLPPSYHIPSGLGSGPV